MQKNLRNALFEAGAGTIGNYENCSFNSKDLERIKEMKIVIL